MIKASSFAMIARVLCSFASSTAPETAERARPAKMPMIIITISNSASVKARRRKTKDEGRGVKDEGRRTKDEGGKSVSYFVLRTSYLGSVCMAFLAVWIAINGLGDLVAE